jgi:hypothetical protein
MTKEQNNEQFNFFYSPPDPPLPFGKRGRVRAKFQIFLVGIYS